MKYKLTKNKKEVFGHTLYQIECIEKFNVEGFRIIEIPDDVEVEIYTDEQEVEEIHEKHSIWR